MLEDLDPEDLFGHNWEFDSLAFAMNVSRALTGQVTAITDSFEEHSCHPPTVTAAYSEASEQQCLYKDVQPFLGFHPLDIVRKTLANTT